MRFLLLLIGVFFYHFLPEAIAQKPTLVFHHLSLYEGLSESTVRSIAEDRKGFMWFGTEDGLNKYDGIKFRTYLHSPSDPYSISSSNMKCLYKDSKGNLWIGTIDGINLYNPTLDNFYNYHSPKLKALSTIKGSIEAIEEDPEGNIWIAAGEEGLYKITSLNLPAEHFKALLDENGKNFNSLKYIDRNSLLVGTNDGLLNFNPSAKTFADLRHHFGKGYRVECIFRDNENKVIIATSTGLKVIDNNTIIKEYVNDPEDPFSINGNNTINIIPYKGNYLIAIDGSGIDYFDVGTEKFYHYTDENESQLSSNNITSLYKDSKGDIWAGTFLNGINFSNSTTNLFALFKNNPYTETGIKKGVVTSFLKDSRGNFWIATDGGGLYKRPGGDKKIVQYTTNMGNKGITSIAVLDLKEDADGHIWVATYNGGLCRYYPDLDSFGYYRHDPADPFSIADDKIKDLALFEGKVWIAGFSTGISILDPATGICRQLRHDPFYPSGIPSDAVQCFHVDTKNNLWIGSMKGISRYLPESNSFKNYLFENKNPNTSAPNYITDIVEDSFHRFWFGTAGGGIIHFDPVKETYRIYTREDGLSSNVIRGMMEDKQNNIWLSTNNGVTKFDILRKKGKAFTFKDGVPAHAFYWESKYRDEEGKIYFGTNNGYLVIDPNMKMQNTQPPPVVITEMKIFNEVVLPNTPSSPLKKSISETKELTLPHDQNSLTFEFTTLNYNNSQNNQYAYMLEGFDKGWVISRDQRTATYTNLNPGKYTFRVKASNNDNVWNEQGTSIDITITPPFYQTWWFNLLLVSNIVLLLYLIYTLRVRRIRVKNQELEETVIQRTKELKESNEQLETFVYKASHDIKGPLKSIIGLTTVGMKDVQDEAAKHYFEHILRSTKKLDNLLMDLLQITKVKQATVEHEKINFEELISEALTSFENLPNYQRMTFNISIEGNGEFYSDKNLLYSLIQNLIENPIKYLDETREHNRLDINISVNHDSTVLSFKDNGVGIPEEYQSKVFDMFFKVNENSNGTGLGLYIVKTTVEKLGGTIELQSFPGEGALFRVTFRNSA